MFRLSTIAQRFTLTPSGWRATKDNLKFSSSSINPTTNSEDTLTRDLVVPAANCRLFVAWHPERDVPFEHTRPLEATEEEIREAAKEASTALKLPTRPLFFRNIRNEVEYLRKITYTNKHRWYAQPRDKKTYRRKHDRDGL
ncbi:39S ribosomal protein L42, mitochondrial-like isoform X2 [Varroa jacobsoni]|uniref:39S ribosomal protein L42, mitochondrial-like isoform X2 n=1 Tax=Varroa jacobsoni TaxID=62625 RepID=UPI000BF55E4C|nr:39S ribosomal protein L42, mitochondrial-like isoform X2 [Varroa jacobsoni]